MNYRPLPLLLLGFLVGLPAGVYGQTKIVRFGGIVAGQVIDVTTKQESGVSTGRFLFGPTVEVRLPHYVSIEVDGLYQNSFYAHNFSGSQFLNTSEYTFSTHIDTYSWEVPALVQWHGFSRHRNVFLGGGLSYRGVFGPYHTTTNVTVFCFAPNCPNQKFVNETTETPISDMGLVIHGGLEFHKGVIHFRPQIRYMRWDASIPELSTSKDGVEALLGISFGK